MSKFTLGIVGLCGGAIGLLLGLVISVLTDDAASVTDEDARNTDAIEVITRSGNDWGVLDALPKSLGPGTPLNHFAEHLFAAGAWDPEKYWTIESSAGDTCRMNFRLFVPGAGHMLMQGVVTSGDETRKELFAELLFRFGVPNDVDLARDHRDSRILIVARAMGLTDDERERLAAFIADLPLAPPSRVREGMLFFVRQMPARVQRNFTRSLAYYEDETKARASNVQLDGFGPAVGAPLSEDWIADIVFMASTTTAFSDDTNYLEVGPWWSLVIYPSSYREYTANEPPQKKADGNTWICWPQLTLDEIDAVRQELNTQGS